jgi:CubicO group peptidase (beta-lactamase class C family)
MSTAGIRVFVGDPADATANWSEKLGLPVGAASGAGFDPARLSGAMEVLKRGLDEGAYPGAVALVVRNGAVVACAALGWAEQDRRPMSFDTIFDLASVTKVIAAVSATLVLLDRGRICLDDAVARFVPAFATSDKQRITLRHLLTHTSGLPPWLPCYTAARSLADTCAYIAAAELEAQPGTQVHYSDLGMIVVRAIVEAAAGQDLPALLKGAISAPLEMRDTMYRPDPVLRDRLAATEQGNRYEQEMVARAGLAFEGWRSRTLIGEANDGNAFYALGGISTHAGLFAPIGDLARFCQMYLQEGRWLDRRVLSAAAVREATRPQTAGLQETYGLGWRIIQRERQTAPPLTASAITRAIFPADRENLPAVPWCGDLAPTGSYGHTGFTGTSLLICPQEQLLAILLTNRVHPDALRCGLDRVRARWHNAVIAALEEPDETH